MNQNGYLNEQDLLRLRMPVSSLFVRITVDSATINPMNQYIRSSFHFVPCFVFISDSLSEVIDSIFVGSKLLSTSKQTCCRETALTVTLIEEAIVQILLIVYLFLCQ